MSAAVRSRFFRSLCFGVVLLALALSACDEPTVHRGPTGPINLQGTPTQVNLAPLVEYPVPENDGYPYDITIGSDGNFWISGHFSPQDNFNIPTVSRLTLKPLLTPYAMPAPELNADGITAGPDGNVWYTIPSSNAIGRITPAGQMTQFPLPANGGPLDIVTGKDGNLWFTEPGDNSIGRMTPEGKVTEFRLPVDASFPNQITLGPDGAVWFTESYRNFVGRIRLRWQDQRACRAGYWARPLWPHGGARQESLDYRHPG